MHEVVQRGEIEVHPDLVQDCLEPGVERRTVLTDHQGGPDLAQALGRIVRLSRDEVVRLRGHPGLFSPCRRAYRAEVTLLMMSGALTTSLRVIMKQKAGRRRHAGEGTARAGSRR
jgi:hypothetical protein